MLIIGCDYHPSFQQIAFVDTETGELGERRLVHPEEAKQFYGELKERDRAVLVGMEASGHARWFERLLSSICGLGMPPRSARSECASRRRIVRAGTTANGKRSVRTRERPDIAMVGSKSPT